MPLLIKYTAECDCGGRYELTELDTTQEPGGTVQIDLDLLGEFTLECTGCNDRLHVPPVSDSMISEGDL